MADFFLVRQARGPEWDHSRGRRDQPGWEEHAAFIDALTEEGVVVLGGPVGDVDGEHAVLVVAVDSEDELHSRFAADPWMGRVLVIESVEPWTLWIRPSSDQAFLPTPAPVPRSRAPRRR